MKRNWSLILLSLSVGLVGCGTTHGVTKATAAPPNKMRSQFADFSGLGNATLTDSGLKLVVSSDSLFKPGHTALDADGLKTVGSLAAVLGKHPTDSVTVAVYTDNGGGDAANLKVSKRRADRIKKELVKKGVSLDHVTAMGEGDADPIGDNTKDAGRAQNRRVEFDFMTI